MKKRGNISLEGYRKNSPDRFNDFNIIPSQHIDMNNVNHDVLMIPMGGRGTGNPILAKPGERYFFPNHDFVFEQGMPENATMRYQRIAKHGGLHKAENGYEMAAKRFMNSLAPQNSNVFAQSAPVEFPTYQNLPYYPSNNTPSWEDIMSAWQQQERRQYPLDPGWGVYPKRTGPGPIRWPITPSRNTGIPWPNEPTFGPGPGGLNPNDETVYQIPPDEICTSRGCFPTKNNSNGPFVLPADMPADWLKGPAKNIINLPYFPDERSNMTFQEMTQEWARAEREATNPNNRRRGNPYMLFEQGGNLPKAQMYNSQVNVPLNTNDFIYTPQEIEKYKNIYDQRIATCKEGDAACLEQANNYYNLYVAPKLNAPNSWRIIENMHKKLGSNSPNKDSYDSWHLAGLYKQAGAKVNLAAPIKNPSQTQDMLKSMSKEDQQKYWINQNLPIGSLVNFGQSGLDEHYGKGQSYNVKQGLVPTNHSARVIGYSPEGVPYIYDFGKISPITDPTFSSMPLSIITSPQEVQGYTYENLKKQGKLEGSKMNPLKIQTKGADYDPDEYEPFVQSLSKNKDLYANALGMSDDEYNNYARHAAALALTETGGGDDTTIRWKYGLPIPSYVSDKLGFGDTKGITQINPDVLFGKKSLANKLASAGIRKDNYDPWNSEHAAIATMALLKDNRSVQDKYAKTAGNKADLSEAEKTYYQWSMPRTLRKGEAKGESEKIKRYLENYNKIQADFDQHNRYLAENRKFGGGLPKAQMYNSQVNKPMPNFDPRVMGPAMRQQQIAAHNRAVAQSSTPDVLQERVPQKFESKALDVLTNPFTAATNMYQHGYLPDNFTQGQSNYLDLAQDYINPASLGRSMYNAATNVFDPEMYKDFAKAGAAGMLDLTGNEIPQEYKDASMRSLQRLGDMAAAVPGIKSASPYVKKALETTQKQLSKGAKVAANVADKKIIKPLQELTQRTTPIQNYTQLNNIKTSNNFNDLDAVSNYFYNKFGSTDNLLKNLKDKDFDTRIIDAVFNHGNDEEKIKLANHLYDVLQGSKIDRALNKADEFVGKKLVKGVKAPDLKEVVEKANEKLAKGVGIKKGELPVKLSANNPNNRVSVKVGDDVTGFIDLSPVGKPAPKFSDILKGIQELKGVKPGFAKDYVDATNFRNAQFPGLAKSGDFPFTVAAEDVGKQLMGQGYSGEINKAISEALKERGSRLYSGATGHTDLGRQRYENLLNKGYVEDISPRIPGSYNMVQPGNEIFMYKKRGGALLNKTLTCPSCGWSWKAVDGGTDIATCHKCGGTAKMQKGGRTPIYVTDPNDPRLQAYNDSLSWYNHGIEGMKRIMDGTWAPGIPANPNPPFIGANEFHEQFAYLRPEDRFYPGQPRPIGYFTTGNVISPDKFGVMSENNGSRWGDQAYYKKPTQPIVYKESTKVTTPKTLKRTLTPIKKKEAVPQEIVDYLQQKQMSLPTQQQEPELRMPTTPKDTTAGKRIAWRMDPDTKKMVPVIGGMKEKVKDMKRLYNKDIPSSTAAIPADFIPQFEPDGNADVVSKKMGGWLDELDEEYRRGGALLNRRETNKNIKSSINQLMRRNETLFGPRGRNFYNPNPMKKYYKGGIAFPQAPTAGDTPGQQESEFYAPNWIPKGPVGFYEHGGIAYPQQPTSDYFFSGSPWMAHYDMGGGLPSGANNMYMPCMNCGGYMEDGGMYYAQPGKIINPTPVPAMDADMYEKNVLAPKDQAYTQDLINKAKKQEEWNKAHPWTRSAGTTPEGAQLFHKTGQSGTPQDYVYNTKSGAYDSYNPTPVIAKQRYGGFQSGGFMSPDNMMDYPIFSQGGDPYDYADGGINNPGFRALPQNVQQNIISNMADGGNVADYDQDQYTRILGNNFMSGVQGNMPNNTMSEAGMQFAQNPYQMPEGEYGYNMNSFNAPNMMNAGNMFDIQDKYDQLKNKNKGIGANMYNTGMFALGTANQYTKYKARKKGSGTLEGTPDMATNQGIGNTMDQSAQSGMARYGAAYIPKAQDGRRHLDYFTKAAGMPQLTFPSPSSASTSSANPNNLSPEALAKKQAFWNEADAYDQKSAMYNQMQQAGYPNMMRQQGQFAPGFQSMYDNFGNDDYNVGRMSRGMQNMLPYLMANPQNTYLQEYNAKKALFGPGARKVSMKFRTVFDPRTGQQVQVPAEGKGSAKGKADMMNDPNISRYSKEDLKLMYGTSDEPKGTSTQKDYEDMNMFERMKVNRQNKRMMKEEGRREKKWGVQNAIPENPDYTAPAGTTFANNMAYAPAPPPAQSGYPTTSGYNLFNTSLNTTRPAYTPRNVFGTPSSNMLTGPFDQNKRMMERLNQSQALRDPLSVQQQRYGGMYEVGGIQELTEDEIQQIMEAGGSVTYLD